MRRGEGGVRDADCIVYPAVKALRPWSRGFWRLRAARQWRRGQGIRNCNVGSHARGQGRAAAYRVTQLGGRPSLAGLVQPQRQDARPAGAP